jgi:uncharacterized protein involved in exopolysaccharide biosynthesis
MTAPNRQASGTADSRDLDLFSLVAMAWRRKLLIGGLTFACMVIALVLALTATPIYRAEVVVVESQDPANGVGGALGQLGGLAGLAGINLNFGSTGVAEQARAMVQSRYLVEQFVDSQKLLPALQARSPGLTTRWRAVEYMRTRVVTVQRDVRKNVTTIAVDWTDAQTAAKWANEFVALGNEILRQRAIDEASRNIAYLDAQLDKTDVVELRKVIYEIIESQTKTLMLANGRREYAFQVIDPAVPPEIRSSPQRSLMVIGGTAGGFLLGLLIAFVIEAYQRRRAREFAV